MKPGGVLVLLALLTAAPVEAHPAVSVVMDRAGNVFYSDLTQVWMITPDGRKLVAVPGVHTHELAIDASGNLIGEEVRNAGDTWQHRIWRRSPDGRVSDVVPWRSGFWQDDGVNRDRAGAMYWIQCPDGACTLRKRSVDGRTTILASGSQFNYPVNWIAVSAAGAVFFCDGPDLRVFDERGGLRTVAAGLAPPGNQNALMGVTLAPDGTALVAVPSRNSVLRVTAEGRVSAAAQSPAPWAPSGVLRASDGTFWILEFDPANRVQIRRIAPGGAVRVF